MRLIVVGAGRVGSRTARVLVEEGHDVVVVDDDPDRVERARSRGFDVVAGDGASDDTLRDAGVEGADAVGGLTGDPDVNFDICMAAKEYGCRTVMRISEDFRAEVYDEYERAVDEVVYPERLGAVGAKTALLGGNFNAIGDLTERLHLVALTVPEGAPVVGQSVNDISVDGARVYAHGREREELVIPMPGTVVDAADRLALLVETDRADEVRTALLG
ncbi:potassium channel family protein [Candidatus Halobonum tyrrellensis]|uniref:TRK potassium uptake system protein n=1 Tax=Candidatus Halobonum tyrrellensis G22 TaxID=1324957 RepID=V4HHH5_9EURY|nr:TrkA family potassium uptake protein [Candidatus Halobonum tyrrellensis]ESP87304.1 TRK potassium uptake system protein [Candidatus Halobonum tyrrellensis G22]